MLRKLFKPVVACVLTMSFLLSTGGAVFASTIADKNIGQHILKVNGKDISVNVSNDNGRYVVTTNNPLNGSDSKEITKAINNYGDSLVSSSTGVMPQTWFSGWDRWTAWADANSSTVESYSTNNVLFSHPTSSSVNLDVYGSIGGWWHGTGTPTYMTLQETLTVSATSFYVSWPPSFYASGSSCTYTSNPFNGASYAYSPYNNMHASSAIAIYSFTQSDNVLVRMNNVDYRNASSIYTNWLTGACTQNPTGSSNHTSG